MWDLGLMFLLDDIFIIILCITHIDYSYRPKMASEFSTRNMTDDIKTEKVRYLLGLLGRHRTVEEINQSLIQEDDGYEDIEVNIFQQLSTMLRKPPIANDNYISETTEQQERVEGVIEDIYKDLIDNKVVCNTPLDLKLHSHFAKSLLIDPLPSYYYGYDSNHTWMIYWLLNFLKISGVLVDQYLTLASEKVLGLLSNGGKGGIGGGVGQIGHVASTYAAVLALVVVKEYKTLNKLRKPLQEWIRSLKNPDGSFSMYIGGESDTRSTYCALVVASLLGFNSEELAKGVPEWLALCQTYEGGFAGVPGTEAHGGYTFCGLAALFLSLPGKEFGQQLHRIIDVPALTRWTVSRQYQLEGGFCGRTNKLVDACYSFWIGAVLGMLETVLDVDSLFDRDGLKAYILNCCQDTNTGGLRDKPGKSSDFYHSNYAAMGLIIAGSRFEFKKDIGNRIDDAAYSIECTKYSDEGLKGINLVFGLAQGDAEEIRTTMLKEEQ